jgi:hypothetical protein
MFSPFIFRNLAILALASGNFCLSVWMISWTGRHFNTALLVRSIAQRALAVSYSAIALIVFLMALALFVDVELTHKARECWRVNRHWSSIRIGMTKGELVQMLGEPAEINFGDQYLYSIHPLTYMHAGVGFRNPKTSANSSLPLDDSAPVEDKDPETGPAWGWIPADFTFYFRDQYFPLLAGFSAVGLLAVTIASLIPRNLQPGWSSLPAYYPALALVFGLAYEAVQRGGWRFDLFFILPLYAVIAVTWAVRWFAIWRR